MLLYVARHAWAGHFGDPEWPDDSLRPLTGPGAERYRRVVAALVDRGFDPMRIATSPYRRCRQTAELLAEATGATIDRLDALAPGAELEEPLAWAADSGVGSVCWVSHNPDCERLLAALIGDSGASLRFAKGGVAAVRFEGPPEPGAGTLLWLATAKLLGV